MCNSELSTFYEWAVSNRLTVNSSKTNYMLISNRFSRGDDFTFNISLNNQILVRKNSVMYLGVLMDDQLKFKDHTLHIGSKIASSIGILYRVSNCVPRSVMFNLYYSLVYPYLNYCNLIWCGTFWNHLNSLWLSQKKILRLINLKPFRHHTNELFLSSKILKLRDVNLLNL